VTANGQHFAKETQIVAAKVERLAIHLERELRFAEGIAIEGLERKQPAAPEVKFAAAKNRVATAQTEALSNAPAPAPAPRAAGPRFPRAATPLPGALLLGRYKIVAELGRGAMGVVHRAWDEKLEREVAIKQMADSLRENAEAMRLFTQEAKALAQLNHTNIVAMYDQVTEDDGVYMVMEFVDGTPLASLIEARGAFPWLEAASLIDQVCAGLAYAHGRKVIHRDIKPANIFVAKDKTVKLGDFGLARVMREVSIRKTEIRGTPLYMAPEQITGTDVDHRADLYAVGCTLFEAVCGRPPFIEGDILFAQLSAKPPVPSSLVPELPAALDALILSLIEKKADDRPGSASEVRTSLRQLFGG
jgi:serine/threonine-protein kinase